MNPEEVFVVETYRRFALEAGNSELANLSEDELVKLIDRVLWNPSRHLEWPQD